MSLYEIMFILQPGWEGEALEEAILRVKNVIEKEKGTVVLLKKLGKRRLAYAINDFREGSYVLLNVQAGRELMPVLEHFFKVNEGYLRYIVIRLEKSGLKGKTDTTPAENMPSEDAGAEDPSKDNTSTGGVAVSSVSVEEVESISVDTAEGMPGAQEGEQGEE